MAGNKEQRQQRQVWTYRATLYIVESTVAILNDHYIN